MVGKNLKCVIQLSLMLRQPHDLSTPPGGVVWRTCVREIAFVEHCGTTSTAPHTVHDEAAYIHLLEVICGLESPMLGETEVMHQFKAFASSLPPEHAALRTLAEQLLADARVIRARYLVGLGSRSYGSVSRRYVKDCRRVAIIGTGMLARELLPFLADQQRVVEVWGRRESFACAVPGVTYRQLDAAQTDVPGGRTAMVVAAPVHSSVISRLAEQYSGLVRLVDLRGESRNDPAPPIADLITLDDVFRDFAAAEQVAHCRAASARKDIRRLARACATRMKLCPSGWHDLCA